MSDFKFTCPDCGQKILINADSKGRRMDCPSCNTTFVVPPPPKSKDILPVAERVARPAKPGGGVSAKAGAAPASKSAPGAAPEPVLPAKSRPAASPEMPVAKPKPAAPAAGPKPAAKTVPAPVPKPVPPAKPVAATAPSATPAKSPAAKPVTSSPAAPVGKPAPKPVPTVKIPAATAPAPTVPPKPGSPAPKPVPSAKPAIVPTTVSPAPKPDAKPAAPPPARAPKPVTQPAAAVKIPTGAPAKAASKPAPAPAVKAEPEVRIAKLTPEIKLELVAAVRSRIAGVAQWLPGKSETGEYVYAAKASGDSWEPVPANDPEATRFSLYGAVMRELEERNVVRPSAGRRAFLDEELTAAIQHVLGREADAAPPSEAERGALTHEQCLAVLDALKQRYQREADDTHLVKSRQTVTEVRLSDLVEKMEQESALRAEEVACALYHEVEELKRRLAKMETGLTQVMKPRAS